MQTKQYLGYLGLTPFVLILLFEQTVARLFVQSPVQIFIFYSAVILSFVAGTLWRKQNSLVNTKRQLLSNLFSLLAFTSLLMPHSIALMILATTYLALLSCEHYFDQVQPDNRSYLKMRLHLTALVIIMHIVAFVLW
jgi:ABC-type uncharacterized transport system permease subunit